MCVDFKFPIMQSEVHHEVENQNDFMQGISQLHHLCYLTGSIIWNIELKNELTLDVSFAYYICKMKVQE